MFLYGVEYYSKYDDDVESDKSYYIMTEEIYWRKANQIHRWFVENIQDGNEDWGMHYVPRECLYRLKQLCEKVLKNKELASTLLPTESGFFFGSVEYDEWYFEDLRYTVEKLDELLKEEKYISFRYQSSW